jgi:hypothetical protein
MKKRVVLAALFWGTKIWAMQVYGDTGSDATSDVASMIAFGALLLLTPITIASLAAWVVYPREMKRFYVEEYDKVLQELEHIEKENVVSVKWNEDALRLAGELLERKKELEDIV